MKNFNERVWELTKKIIHHLECNGYGFINGVFLELNNNSFFRQIIGAVSALCRNSFGAVALSYSQAKFLLSLDLINPIPYAELVVDRNLSGYEKISLAEKTIMQFRENLLKEKSFALNESHIIISPQQYLSAVKYLNQKTPVID